MGAILSAARAARKTAGYALRANLPYGASAITGSARRSCSMASRHVRKLLRSSYQLSESDEGEESGARDRIHDEIEHKDIHE